MDFCDFTDNTIFKFLNFEFLGWPDFFLLVFGTREQDEGGFDDLLKFLSLFFC